MKYVIEDELYDKINNILNDYDDLLERLVESGLGPSLKEDWEDLKTVRNEYDVLLIYEDKNISNEDNSELKVGDYVRVVDCGECYNTYSDWVKKYIHDPTDKYCWDYGKSCCDEDRGKILCLAPHEYGTAQLAYVKMNYGLCYLIGVNGLVKI